MYTGERNLKPLVINDFIQLTLTYATNNIGDTPLPAFSPPHAPDAKGLEGGEPFEGGGEARGAFEAYVIQAAGQGRRRGRDN